VRAVDVLALAAANLLFFAAGAGVTRLLGAWRTPRGLAGLIGVSYLAGVAATGIGLQLLLVLGLSFGVPLVVGLCAVLALSGLAARGASDRPRVSVAVPRTMLPLVAVLVGIVALMAVDLWFQPMGVWDAWAQWTAKARSIVDFDGLDARVLGNPAYREWNPDYPLLVPSIEAADFSFMGKVDTLAIHFQFLLVYAGFLLALLELLRGRVREVLVWPFVVAVALAPAVQIQTASAIADVPVAVMFALAGLYAWLWLVDSDRVALRLFSLFAAGALATKFEGRIFVGALSVTLVAVLLIVDRRRALPTVVAAVAAGVVGLLPWWLWVSDHKVRGSFSTAVGDRLGTGLIDKAGRLPTIVEVLSRNAVNPSRWLLLSLVVVASLGVAWWGLRGRREVWLVLGTLALCAGGLVLVYWATPLDYHVHLALSARRVVTGPVLFAAAVVPLLLESAIRSRSSREHSSQ
jgi:hypothetical protein